MLFISGDFMISYSSLREIQKKETESAALSRLAENFYEQVAEFLKKKKEEALISKSILVIKEYENLKKVVMAIQTKREEKILLLTLRGQEIDGLTVQEQLMLRDISSIVEKYRNSVLEILASETVEVPKIKKIKIVKDVEQYTGLDNHIYGPFKNGQETALPFSEAEWLLKSHLAELI